MQRFRGADGKDAEITSVPVLCWKGRKESQVKKQTNKQTNKRARTDAEQGLSVSDWAKCDKAFSFGRTVLLKVEARYTCGLRAFAQGREEVFNTLIKSRLRIVHEVG